jgi:hypothetical protein
MWQLGTPTDLDNAGNSVQGKLSAVQKLYLSTIEHHGWASAQA